YLAYNVASPRLSSKSAANSLAVTSPSAASSSIGRLDGNPAPGSPSCARLACASGSIVLLADSATQLGEVAVIGTPSRTQRHRTSPAASPAFHALHPASLALPLVCPPAGCGA